VIAAPPLVNRERVEAFMAEAGLHAVIGASQANVFYLSGYHCWLEPLMLGWMAQPGGSSHPVQESFALLPRDGEPALIVGAFFAPDALASWVDDVRVHGKLGFDDALPAAEPAAVAARVYAAHQHSGGRAAVDELVAAIRDRGLAEARIGLDLSGAVPGLRERLAAQLPGAELRDCTSLLRLVRMVKTEPELALLARSAEINERSAIEAARSAAAGMPVAELLDRFLASVAGAGAHFDHFSPGIAGLGLSTSTTYPLEAGAVLCLDYGCVYGRYFSDAGITIALDDPAPELAARYAALRECIVEVGVGAMRPGVRGSAVHHAMVDHLAARGISAVFPHGHGLGIELRDYPILVPDAGLRIVDECIDVSADLELEPGMVINLEASVFLPGVASLEVEITTLVTETGARPFVPQERATPVRPA
jgi:Xaa-Pro dipeptidase